jgi:hypothetical protein
LLKISRIPHRENVQSPQGKNGKGQSVARCLEMEKMVCARASTLSGSPTAKGEVKREDAMKEWEGERNVYERREDEDAKVIQFFIRTLASERRKHGIKS